MSKIGFIGLGIMGAPMAGHLQAGGHDLSVFTIGPVLLNPDTGERDYRAFGQKVDADAAAAESHTMPIDWKTVLENAHS